jgi:hypothetical protein
MHSSSTTFRILRPAAAQKGKPPINTAFYQHRRRRVEGEVSNFKLLSTGSGKNQSKINIEIQQTKHEEQRVQPFLNIILSRIRIAKCLANFLNNIRYTFFQDKNVRLTPWCR